MDCNPLSFLTITGLWWPHSEIVTISFHKQCDRSNGELCEPRNTKWNTRQQAKKSKSHFSGKRRKKVREKECTIYSVGCKTKNHHKSIGTSNKQGELLNHTQRDCDYSCRCKTNRFEQIPAERRRDDSASIQETEPLRQWVLRFGIKNLLVSQLAKHNES